MVNCAKKSDKSDKSDNFKAMSLISWNKKVSNFMPKLSDLSNLSNFFATFTLPIKFIFFLK